MAKKSMIAREVKRKKLVNKYASKRKSLLDEFNSAKDPMKRLEIHRKIQGLQGIQRQQELEIDAGLLVNQEGFIEISLCRNQLRLRAHNGELPGLVKSSW